MPTEPMIYTLFQQESDRANTQYSCSWCPDLVRFSKLREHAQFKHGVIDFAMNNSMVRRIVFSLVVDESWLAEQLIFRCKFPGCSEQVSGDLLDTHARKHDGQVITIEESTWRTDRRPQGESS